MESFKQILKSLDKEKTKPEEVVVESLSPSQSLQVEVDTTSKTMTIHDYDTRYQAFTNAKAVDNTVRVEQGEYVVLPVNSSVAGIGTHHVIPCIVVCAVSNTYYGLAHFDSFSVSDSLEAFFKQFHGDPSLKIKIYGGKLGMDPLRTGIENKTAVLKFINEHIPETNIEVFEPPLVGFFNCVLYRKGHVDTNQFATGVNVNEEKGLNMRLLHGIRGIIYAVQSRTEHFISLNLNEAYSGSSQPFFLDRLALQALEQYDPGTAEDDKKYWSNDVSGVLLAAEARMAFYFIQTEVNTQRTVLKNQLKEQMPTRLATDLIKVAPIYVGPGAEALNEKLGILLIKLHSSGLISDGNISYALDLFNKLSQYPVMNEVIPIVVLRYKIDQNYLEAKLKEIFGNHLDNLAYGVDVNSESLVSVVKTAIEEKNPGLRAIQILKLQDKDMSKQTTGKLVKVLCKFYNMDYDETIAAICLRYNAQLQLEENKAEIVDVLDEKEELNKDHFLQAIKSSFTGLKKRIAERILDEIWPGAKSSRKAIDLLFSSLPHDNKEQFIEDYRRLADFFPDKHFQAISVEDIKGMSFNKKDPGIKGITGYLIQDSIIHVMQNSSAFVLDMEKETITSASLTKVIRDNFHYKNDEGLLALEINKNDVSNRL